MIWIFLGPPGSGKGTQAKLLGYEHVAMGDMLREAVREETEIGKKVKAVIEAGKLAPDDLVFELLKNKMNKIGKPLDRARGKDKNVVLDGFPRSFAQVEMLEELKLPIAKVIYFKLAQALVVERIAGRRSCKSCGAVYHLKYNPPKIEEKCDRCSGELYQRKDDEETTIAERFRVYEKETRPLLDYYRGKNLLVELDAQGEIQEIYGRLIKLINDPN